MSAEAQPLHDYKKDISHGVWFFLHTMAEAAQTPELMRAYAFYFRNICDKMGCSCENHCKKMLQDIPPEDYFKMKDSKGVPVGCLYHSVVCHNAVNKRLGKPTYAFEQILPMYRGEKATEVIKDCEAKIATPLEAPSRNEPSRYHTSRAPQVRQRHQERKNRARALKGTQVQSSSTGRPRMRIVPV